MKFLRRLRFPTASLHTKLTVALAALVAVVAAGSATVLVEREREQRLHELEGRATRIASLLQQSLAQGLWNVDSKAIQRQLDALAPDPEVAEVTVTAVGYGTVATAGPRHPSDATGAVVRIRPIQYAQFEGFPLEKIGEVRVVLTRAEAEAAIARARRAILAMAAAVVLTLFAATTLLLKRMLQRPVTRLEAMVNRLAAGDLDARCPVDSGDELGRLAERVNVMADRLRGFTAHLRESEARFRTFVDHAMDAFFLHDEQLTVLDVNRQACESLGYSREELIGKRPRDFDAGLDGASIVRLAEQVGAGETVTFESLHQRKNGTVFPVEIRSRQFHQGGHRFRLSLARDITERKRAEEQRERLRELEAELAHINRVSLLGELTASIAHELGQPLSGVVSNGGACLRWLGRDEPNLEEAREAAKRIVRDGKRAGEVIARIRALTRRTTAPREKLDLNETIRDVLVLVGNEAMRNSVTIHTQYAAALAPVAGDRVQVQQVVLNLVLNGIEAMGSVSDWARDLVITTRNLDPDQVQVTVEDSGTGLDANAMDKIFDPFYTTKPTGMGMGLSISRSIVQAHGGRLWAEAKDGPGTRFHFTLPTFREAGSHL